MTIPARMLKAYEMTNVDRAIVDFAKIENPTVADLNVVRAQANVQIGIEKYRVNALSMTERERLEERHNSGNMADYMEAFTDPRPHSECHCHAIISGGHSEAAVLRAVMAWLAMRIDDPRNGCWLPRNTAVRSKMPRWLRNAIPHSRTHRKTYYRWLEDNISFTSTLDALILKLRMIRICLQQGNVRADILLDLGYEMNA